MAPVSNVNEAMASDNFKLLFFYLQTRALKAREELIIYIKQFNLGFFYFLYENKRLNSFPQQIALNSRI